MTSDEQPTQPITDAELMAINYNLNEALNRCGELYLVTDAPKDMRRLLVEVDRLRAALTALGRNEQAACNRSLELEAMFAAVVSLHQPTAMNSCGHRTCTECDTPGYYQEWPCPTLVALGFEEQ